MKLAKALVLATTIGGIALVIERNRRSRKAMNLETRSVFKLAAEEAKNLEHAVGFLGDTYDLVTDLEVQYDTLPYLCRFPNDVETNDGTFAAGLNAHLVFICRRQLTLGTLTLLRGYRNDCQLHLRRALETCGFAAKMEKHPHMARVWMEAGNDEEAYERFRKKFVKLFPDDDPRLKMLGEHYDICSKAMHSNPYGVAHYFAHRGRTPSAPSIDVFDVGTNAKLVATFMTCADLYLVMLRVFERLLLPYTGDRITDWSGQLAAAEEKFRVKHAYWMPLVEAETQRLKNLNDGAPEAP